MDGSKLLVGRDFTAADLELIRETVAIFPRLSRMELARTICEHLGWLTPTGKYKEWSCLELLARLEAWGEVRLPPKGMTGPVRARRVVPSERTDAPGQITGKLAELEPVAVEPVRDKEERRLWNEYVERYHPLGYKVPFGAHQRYFIWGQAERLGCLLFAASAWALEARDVFIGWTVADRQRRLELVVNNSRFLVFPWVRVKNLASRALALAARRIRGDWLARYGYGPVLLETFVDGSRYSGTCYRAANWLALGKTAGRGRMDRHKEYRLSPKLIYVYPLTADFRVWLRGQREVDAGKPEGVSRDEQA